MIVWSMALVFFLPALPWNPVHRDFSDISIQLGQPLNSWPHVILTNWCYDLAATAIRIHCPYHWRYFDVKDCPAQDFSEVVFFKGIILETGDWSKKPNQSPSGWFLDGSGSDWSDLGSITNHHLKLIIDKCSHFFGMSSLEQRRS